MGLHLQRVMDDVLHLMMDHGVCVCICVCGGWLACLLGCLKKAGGL